MTIYTIGHSNIAIEQFIDLLRLHRIQGLIDTRSQPYSRYAPQFNRGSLQTSLRHASITYLYLGNQLGGRPQGAHYYLPRGEVDYDRLQEAPFYREGLKRLKHEAAAYCVAIMCSEADYQHCHRYNLISRSLVRDGVEVYHILHSGDLEPTCRHEFHPTIRQFGLFEEGSVESVQFHPPTGSMRLLTSPEACL